MNNIDEYIKNLRKEILNLCKQLKQNYEIVVNDSLIEIKGERVLLKIDISNKWIGYDLICYIDDRRKINIYEDTDIYPIEKNDIERDIVEEAKDVLKSIINNQIYLGSAGKKRYIAYWSDQKQCFVISIQTRFLIKSACLSKQELEDMPCMGQLEVPQRAIKDAVDEVEKALKKFDSFDSTDYDKKIALNHNGSIKLLMSQKQATKQIAVSHTGTYSRTNLLTLALKYNGAWYVKHFQDDEAVINLKNMPKHLETAYKLALEFFKNESVTVKRNLLMSPSYLIVRLDEKEFIFSKLNRRTIKQLRKNNSNDWFIKYDNKI